MPIGTLTKKIHCHPRLSVMAPPTSGPTATDPPIVAPQMPNAVPRSRPLNALASKASDVANIIEPPTPWRPRATLRKVGPLARPHRNDAAVKTPRPTMKTSLRPRMSAIDPAVSCSAARDSA
ncbi:MAG: hypothetical protein QOH13_725 [Thermoleophilaceae bacterium]|nr:hypothetical protein [Thermoleophilaceae bacterium]